MPSYQLTAAWQKVASAGQTVEVQNVTGGPAVIMTSANGPPPTSDGLQMTDRGASRQYTLAADLYAHSISMFAAPTLAVMDGFVLSGTNLGSTSASTTSTPAAPTNSASPVISGTAQVGKALIASQGVWTGSPTSYAYQWNRSGMAIAGATAATYQPVSADVGSTLTVAVTATNAGGNATTTSVPTSAVQAAPDSAPTGYSLLTGADGAQLTGADGSSLYAAG